MGDRRRRATRAAPRRRSAPFAIAAAVSALRETGWERIQAHEQELLERLVAGLDAIPGVRTYELWERGHDRVGVVSFNVAGVDPALLAAALGAEHGIGVRDGAFCAHPLMEHFGARGGAVRASIGVGTRADDIDRLLEAVDADRPPRAELELRRARRLRAARPRSASAPVTRRTAQRPARGSGITLSRRRPDAHRPRARKRCAQKMSSKIALFVSRIVLT